MEDSFSSVVGIIDFDSVERLMPTRLHRPDPRSSDSNSERPTLKIFAPADDLNGSVGFEGVANQGDNWGASHHAEQVSCAVDSPAPHFARVVMADLAQLRMDLLEELEAIQRRLAKMINES